MPAGYANINAFGINASGTIVGNATDILGNDYAFVYSGGSWQALGGNMYTANGINDDGVIVGQTSGSGDYVLSGGVGGTQMNIGGMGAAYAINNSGVVVGGAQQSNQSQRRQRPPILQWIAERPTTAAHCTA